MAETDRVAGHAVLVTDLGGEVGHEHEASTPRQFTGTEPRRIRIVSAYAIVPGGSLDGYRNRNINSRMAPTKRIRMTDSNSSKHVPSQPVIVQEDTHQNEIPDNIDSDLYSTDSPTNSFKEFTIEPDDDLVEALRNNGYTVEFRDR